MNKKGVSGIVIWTASRIIIPAIIILLLLVFVNRELGSDPFTTKWKAQELRFTTEIMQSISDPVWGVFFNEKDTLVTLRQNQVLITPVGQKQSVINLALKTGATNARFTNSGYISSVNHAFSGDVVFAKQHDALIFLKEKKSVEYPEYLCEVAKPEKIPANPKIVLLAGSHDADKTVIDQVKELIEKGMVSAEVYTTTEALQKSDLLLSFKCSSKQGKEKNKKENEKKTTLYIGSPLDWDFACGLRKELGGKNIEIVQKPLNIFKFPAEKSIAIEFPCDKKQDATKIFSFTYSLLS